MAIPTMQNNTPQAGHISWGSFTIQLNGVSYGVPAASSADRWVWWEYRAGVPILNSGPDVPATLTDDDLVLFANKNGIGVRVQSTNFVDGELLVDGSIFADALSVNLINSQHIVTAGLDAGVIKFGDMHGDRIRVGTLAGDRIIAKSIFASHLAITDFENYVSDPYFTLGHWVTQLSAGVTIVDTTTMPAGIGSGKVMRFTGGGTREVRGAQRIDMTPADVGYISVYVRKITATASPVGAVHIRARHWDAAGNNTTPFYLEKTLANSAMVQNTWYEVFIDPAVLPAGKVAASVELLTVGVNATDTFEFAIPSLYKKANGKLIVDGTIRGKHMVADSVTSREIGANSITASELTVGTLGDMLVPNGGFEDDAGWTKAATATRVAAAARTGGWGMRLTANGSPGLINEMPFPVSPGEILSTSIFARGVTATTGLYLRIQWRNAAGAQISTSDPVANKAVPVDTVWYEFTQPSAAAPAGTVSALVQIFNTTGSVDIDDVGIRKQVISAQIKDGAIVAAKIDTGAVTADKVSSDIIIANELYSREGYFGEIEAEKVKSGTLEATLALLGQLGVGDITIDDQIGITVPSPKGDTVLRSDGTGSTFAGSIETDDVTVDGGLTLNGATNNINGSLGLANVVVPPTVAPTITRTWPYTKPIGADTFHIAESLDLDANGFPTSWVTVNWNAKTVKKYDKVTGALLATYDGPADWDIFSVCSAKGFYVMTARKISTSEIWLCRMTATGTSFTALQKIGNLADIAGWMVGTGVDSTTGNPMTAYVIATGTNAGKIRVETWSGAVGDIATNRIANELYDGSSDGVTKTDWCYGVGRGPWGWNGEDVVYINTGYVCRFYDRTTKLYSWWPGFAESIKGQTPTKDGKFVYVGFSTYRVYEWAIQNTFNNTTVVAKYAWYDSDSAGSGIHETTPSPPKQLDAAWRWSWVEVTTPAPSDTGQPDSPDSVAIYLNEQRQPQLAPGVTKGQYRTVSAGAAPKTVNEFNVEGVASYPGEIFSAATKPDGVTPKLRMKGDGTGHWGDLTVDGAGKAVIGGDTGWIEVTAFTNLWENYGGSWRTCGYRRIGNRVHLKGLVRTPTGTIAIPAVPFYLPVGFRPPADVMVSPVYERISGAFDATGDGAKTVRTTTNNTGTSGTGHDHGVTVTAYDINTAVLFQSVAGRMDIRSSDGALVVVNGHFNTAAWINFDNVSFLID